MRLNGLEEGTFAYRQQQSYLPYAHKVLLAFIDNAGSFLGAGLVTLGNAFVGFVIGAIVGYALALLMSRALWVARSFYVYIIGSQMVPVIALAPILYGIIRDETILKITVAAYLTFFPVTVNVLARPAQRGPARARPDAQLRGLARRRSTASCACRPRCPSCSTR